MLNPWRTSRAAAASDRASRAARDAAAASGDSRDDDPERWAVSWVLNNKLGIWLGCPWEARYKPLARLASPKALLRDSAAPNTACTAEEASL